MSDGAVNEDNSNNFTLNEHHIRSKKLLCEKLQVYLEESDMEKILILFRNIHTIKIAKESPCDILITVISFLTSGNTISGRAFTCCENVMDILAEYCEPAELILYLVEQMQIANSELCFTMLLQPLKKCLLKCNNLFKVFDICIDTIRNVLSALPVPNSEVLQLSIQCNQINNPLKMDEVTKRIVYVYDAICHFIQSLLHDVRFDFKEAIQPITCHGLTYLKSLTGPYYLKEYILALLLSMFGEPICSINLESLEIITVMTKITKIITLIESNPFNWMIVYNSLNKKSSKLLKKLNKTFDHFQGLHSNTYLKPVSNLSVSNWFWFVICQTRQYSLPQVYDLHFIFHNCVHHANCFLSSSKEVLIFKGLVLTNVIIERTNLTLISREALDLPHHSQILQNLIKIMINCTVEDYRKFAMKVFVKYINIFTINAKYFILLKLFDTNSHPGVLSLMIGIIKNIISQQIELDQVVSGNSPDDMFYGENLMILMKKVNRLKHECSTDLVEISDQLMSALNLIRYLIIRDKINISGIWDFISEIKESFLKPLQNNINLNKTKWNIKLSDLLLKQNKYNADSNMKLNMSTGNFDMPLEVNIQFCLRAVTTIEVIESILARVNEILNVRDSSNQGAITN